MLVVFFACTASTNLTAASLAQTIFCLPSDSLPVILPDLSIETPTMSRLLQGCSLSEKFKVQLAAPGLLPGSTGESPLLYLFKSIGVETVTAAKIAVTDKRVQSLKSFLVTLLYKLFSLLCLLNIFN